MFHSKKGREYGGYSGFRQWLILAKSAVSGWNRENWVMVLH
jgi:hypothetical protein